MYIDLKKEIQNIIEIVNKCPESLKEKCFEILLNSYLSMHKSHEQIINTNNVSVKQDEDANNNLENEEIEEEIKENQFHVVIRRLLSSNGISMKDINNLYYLQNNTLMPLYDTLYTQKMSDSQIRIALLSAFERGYSDNNLEFSIEEVRERCKTFKCYDASNYMTIFKRNKELFDNIEEKDSDIVKLSNDGKKKMVEILLAISRGE